MYEGLDPLYERGYEVLLDKQGVTQQLPPATGAFLILAVPSEDEFAFTVEEFWFEATHMPRYLSRGDLWVVKFRDWTMKCDLLRILEWRAIAQSAGPVDVRYIGARMREWVDAATWRDLHESFAHFAEGDAWRALLATTQLFGRVARMSPMHTGSRIHWRWSSKYRAISPATRRRQRRQSVILIRLGQRPASEARTPSASAPPSCQREDTVVVEPSWRRSP